MLAVCLERMYTYVHVHVQSYIRMGKNIQGKSFQSETHTHDVAPLYFLKCVYTTSDWPSVIQKLSRFIIPHLSE